MLDYNSIVNSFMIKNRNIKEERLEINDYEITYYRQKDNKDFVIFDNNDSLIHFNSKEDLKQFIIESVIEGNGSYPDIYYKGSNLLKDYSEEVAYHISLTSNRENILTKGLIPNGENNLDTLPTSIYLDRYKIKKIPNNFFKSLSVYLYPEYYLSSSEGIYSNNIDLYGVDISGLDWRIGSQFLSGNCMVTCNILDNEIISTDKDKIKEAKNYWKNSFSKKEFLEHSENIIKSNNNWGLDEILYCGIIDKSRIKLIGTFDSELILWYFYENRIKDFIKEEYLDIYSNILKRINRNQKLVRTLIKENQVIEKELFSLSTEKRGF